MGNLYQKLLFWGILAAKVKDSVIVGTWKTLPTPNFVIIA